MSHQITLSPSQRSFRAEDGSVLLEAALAQGIGLPYGCKSGFCGACKGKVLSGDFSHGKASEQALSDADRALGFTLICCASARSDLTIEIRELQGSADYPVRIMPARVSEMTAVATDVMVLQLKLPGSDTFRFRPGQYVDILLKDGQRRSFSIATPPHVQDHIELHIRQVPGGLYTEHVFKGMKPRDILRLEGPLGSFFLDEDSNAPIILLAGGTGFAPIKSIVEHAIERQIRRPMHLYWGASDPEGLYFDQLARDWANRIDGFRYTPVISSADATGSWGGRTGLVHHALMNDYEELSTVQVYACGAPAMIDAARTDLISKRGLPESAFFADAFTFSTAPP